MKNINVLSTFFKPISSLLLIAALFSQPVLAHPERQKQPNLRMLFKQLDLTLAQRQTIHAGIKQSKNTDAVSDHKNTRQQLKALIQADDFDRDAVLALLTSNAQKTANKQWQKIQTQHLIWQTLTTEQRQKWSEFQPLRQRQSKRGNKSSTHHQPKLSFLALTSEQQQQIKQLHNATQSQRAEFHDLMKTIKQQEFSLIGSDSFDQPQWQQLYAQYQPQVLNFAVLQAENKHQVWQLLTPEQQIKLQQKMARKHARRKGKNKSHHRQQS